MRQIDLIQSDAIEREKFEKVVETTTEKIIKSSRGSKKKTRVSFERARDNTIGKNRGGVALESVTRGRREDKNDRRSQDALEAIVLERHRPAWFIENDLIQIVENDEVGEYPDLELIRDKKEKLEDLIKHIGRVDLVNHQNNFVGTGWLIDKDIVVTNAHVANVFCKLDRFSGWDFDVNDLDDPIESRLDLVRQRNTKSDRKRRLEIIDVLYVAAQGEPDIAFFRVDNDQGLDPLTLDTKAHRSRLPVATIGYPAKDSRNDAVLMRRLFGVDYNVKRFSPGYITAFDRSMQEYLGDYSSLGGNSGSAVLSLDNLEVVGLHFAGLFKKANYAVPSDLVASALRRIKTRVHITEAPKKANEKSTPAKQLKDREGYDPEFLGKAELCVPLPDLGAHKDDMAPVSDDDDDILKYTHFSVIQSMSRRLARLTAVNIDGEKAVRLKRGTDKWFFDGRIDPDHQIGNVLYIRNDLDRGHLVKRLDPVWGTSKKIAKQAEFDSFHYTNSAPQHKDLNRDIWLGLENYIMDSASTDGFKVSIFSGPIFRESDKKLKSQPGAEDIPIPEEFWKIAVMVNSDTGKLSATAYILSQGDMIRDMTESAFILGQYKVYQVKISKVETATGLDFGHLRDFDPLSGAQESRFGEAAFEVSSPANIRLS